MQVLLNDDVASPCKPKILSANERSVESGITTRILRSVDESKKVAIIEVAEAVCFIDS